MVKGIITYIPKEFKIELDDYKSKYNILRNSDAMKLMIRDLRIGKEIRLRLGGRK